VQNEKPPTWKILTRIGIPVGVLLLLAALIIEDVGAQAFQNVKGVTLPLVIIGALITVSCLAVNYDALMRVFTLRKTRLGANLAVLIALLFALMGLICYISTRRFARMDMTGRRKHTLHSKTERMLRSLDRDVEVTVLYNSQNPEVRFLWITRVLDMLEEFRTLTRRISTRQYDVSMGPQLSEFRQKVLPSVEKQDDLTDSCVIFKAAGAEEVVPYEKTIKRPEWQGGKPRLLVESAFASALAKLMEKEKAVVYVLTGHGERPLEGRAGGFRGPMSREETILSSERLSLSTLVSKLRRDNMEVKSLNLAAGDVIPKDCKVLIIPGPRTPPFSRAEAEKIREYLDQRDGRLLALLDSDAVSSVGTSPGELASVLAEYGIRVRHDAVGMVEAPSFAITSRGLVQMSAAQQSVPVKSDGYADHPITSDLTNYTITLVQPSVIEIPNPQPRPGLTVRALLTGVSGSWGETTLGKEMESSRYDAGNDVPGPVVLAAVAGPSPPPSYGMPMPPPADLPGPRVVVIGSSFSFTNEVAEQAPRNLTFLQNAISWLAARPYLIGIPPKDIDIHLTSLSAGQIRASRWVFIGILPACIIVLGMAVWQVRRR